LNSSSVVVEVKHVGWILRNPGDEAVDHLHVDAERTGCCTPVAFQRSSFSFEKFASETFTHICQSGGICGGKGAYPARSQSDARVADASKS
jgi:hypothetical protein